MAQESESDKNQPTPLSQARSKRAGGFRIDASEDRLRQLLAEVVEEGVSAKISRLETSINRMMDHIDAVTRGEAEDSALRVTTDHSATDLAIAGIDLPSNDYYTYTCDMLAERLGITRHHVLQMIKLFNLRGDKLHHGLIQTGKRSQISKWSEATLVRLKKALETQEYLLSQ